MNSHDEAAMRSTIIEVMERMVRADHLGDIWDELPFICDALGVGRSEYNDDLGRPVFPWEEELDEDEEGTWVQLLRG